MQVRAFPFCLERRAAAHDQWPAWIWSRALAEQRKRDTRGEKFAGHVDMRQRLTDWRNTPAIPSFRQALKVRAWRLSAAYRSSGLRQ